MGEYRDIHFYNRDHTEYYNHRVLSYVRWSQDEKLIIIINFDANDGFGFELKIPEEITREWGLQDGEHHLREQLQNAKESTLRVLHGLGEFRVDIQPLESQIFRVY